MRISRYGRNRSSPPSSGTRKPKPSRWPLAVPTTTGRRSIRQYSFARLTSSSPSRAMAPSRLPSASRSAGSRMPSSVGERLECERLLRLAQLREQELAARDRFRIPCRFVAEARIFLLPAWLAGHGFTEIDMKQVPAYIDAPSAGVAPAATCAQVAELVDALGSGLSAERRGGSSPLLGTILLRAGIVDECRRGSPRSLAATRLTVARRTA